jgi:hypothetical protein
MNVERIVMPGTRRRNSSMISSSARRSRAGASRAALGMRVLQRHVHVLADLRQRAIASISSSSTVAG